PAGRMCGIDEVARFVSVLAGDGAAWMNGATIDFTGGMTQSLLDLVLNGGEQA
ncbi:MAG: SDR family NAD(P)-dependent oxidoreductase, partial [Polyangiaceae bacterium]|nr:SDR family NAD(P)-dependent oxidoreductase [Polyangiaceae bacterium]